MREGFHAGSNDSVPRLVGGGRHCHITVTALLPIISTLVQALEHLALTRMVKK